MPQSDDKLEIIDAYFSSKSSLLQTAQVPKSDDKLEIIDAYFSNKSSLLQTAQASLNSQGNILCNLFLSQTLAKSVSAACFER